MNEGRCTWPPKIEGWKEGTRSLLGLSHFLGGSQSRVTRWQYELEDTSSALPFPSEGGKRNRLGHESGYGFERKNFLAR